MGRLRYSRDARQDLLGLWIHIALENPDAADRLIDSIEEACGKLREYPRIGVARPDIGDDARVLIVDRWMAIYRLVRRSFASSMAPVICSVSLGSHRTSHKT